MARALLTSVPGLADIFEGVGLKAVDIGARGKPRRELIALAPFTHLFACEPEAVEAERLAAELRQSAPWRDVTIITDAIASVEGVATLYETAKPGMSSLLEPDPDVYERYVNAGVYKVAARTPVGTVRLDTAAARYGFADAAYLKIDTQGTELDILASGDDLVSRSICGVYLEANFQPAYRGQSLFGDTDAFLRSRDFILLDLRRTHLRGYHFRGDIYSRPQVVWSHCFYLRDPRRIAERGGDEAVPMLVRTLALALAYEHHDVALSMVETWPSAEPLRNAFGPEIRDAVEQHAVEATERILRGLSEEEAAALLNRSQRD